MAKLDKMPWFKFYYERFIIGTSHMSDAEVGAYLRLLIRQYDKGGISGSDRRLKNPNVRAKFIENQDGLFYNPTMEAVKAEQLGSSVKSSEFGKKGAEKRWGKHSPPIGEANGLAIETPMPFYSDKKREDKEEDKSKSKNLVEEKYNEYSSEQIWLTDTCMVLKTRPDILLPLLKEFLGLQNSAEDLAGRSRKDLKSHFVRWSRIELEKNNPKQNVQTTSSNYLEKYGIKG